MIETRIEGKRGCGFRKAGGLYLVSDALGRACGKLPLTLTVCPCCGAGIKPSRGWTWVDADKLFADRPCTHDLESRSGHGVSIPEACYGCPLSSPLGRAGLLWIGESFYKTPEDWVAEANRMGISRRIAHVPTDFVLGETWVLLAHRKAIRIDRGSGHVDFASGIFRVFQPQRIEYVVKASDPQHKLDLLEKRGITLVRVQKPDEFPLT